MLGFVFVNPIYVSYPLILEETHILLLSIWVPLLVCAAWGCLGRIVGICLHLFLAT